MAGIRLGFTTANARWINLMEAIIERGNLGNPTPDDLILTAALASSIFLKIYKATEYASGNGVIFNPILVITTSVPLESIRGLVESWLENRFYCFRSCFMISSAVNTALSNKHDLL
ncbi:MAG: hypothetical protein QW476_03110 [Candidatus Bathyarchaeia archaeon]